LKWSQEKAMGISLKTENGEESGRAMKIRGTEGGSPEALEVAGFRLLPEEPKRGCSCFFSIPIGLRRWYGRKREFGEGQEDTDRG
jgi:hypothetical protein